MNETDVVRALAALAQQARLRIFRTLIVAGEDGLTPGDLSTALDITTNTLSFHLKELNNAGLVSQQRRGRNLIYRAEFTTMDQLLGYLTENCCEGAACLPSTSRTCKPNRTRRKIA